MGSSAKRKKEKKKDFQKPKFKVGKTQAKASNFTNTSFKSKAITVNQLLPGADVDDPLAQFKHQLSLVASKSESQRIDGLRFLTSKLTGDPPYNPIGSLEVLLKTLPLVSDSSSAVRSQLLKLFKGLPPADVEPYVEKIILYVRAAMTNLSSEISEDSMGVLEWLLDIAPSEVVSAPGCWVKPLNCFVSVLRWSAYLDKPANSGKGWTAVSQTSSMSSEKKKQAQARQLAVLGKFLKAGFTKPKMAEVTTSAEYKFLKSIYVAPKEPNAFAHLNVFGAPRDEDDQMYMDRESRQRVFTKKVGKAVYKGVLEARKQGGTVGRAANELEKVLKEGLDGYAGSAHADFEYSLRGLMALW